ncbi:sensor histidine kinase [Pseudonocardia humida]|uniref:Sensor histidine kinase n=1 Tax=Pseudonocardia humida TaxID=2800819 RepID=A0ABT1A1B8_9PSEU|nr:histidine kinase [Pseudonocardia humida]MCO1656684.1 sensor histidine kinase [Pseudonocardia humida]
MSTGDAAGPVRDLAEMTVGQWYAWSGGWVLLLVPQLWTAVTVDRPVGLRVLLVLALLGYGACYLHGLYIAVKRRSAWFSVALIATMAVLWAVGFVGLGAGDGSRLYTVAFVVVAVGILTSPPHGPPATLLTAVAALGVAWALGQEIGWDEVFAMVALGLGMIAVFALVRGNSELREAREELATMAVTAERERMARDLHDVLGHSLTTITVKAGLARRLLESGAHDRAAVEVADVESLGRQALADVRSTVAANRVTSLAAELAGAREALRAAEITADLPHAVDDVPGERQQAFAHVVREGVTNVIRHSGAGRCTIRLTPESVEVVDDGGGGTGVPGNGITGLGERLAAAGGRVEAGPVPGGGYRLRAECVPASRRVRSGPA